MGDKSMHKIILIFLTIIFTSACIILAEDDQNKLQNGSFEKGQTWTNTYNQLDQSQIPDWNTTAYEGKIELLRKNTGVYIKNVLLNPTEGYYAAELNADEESSLYQIVKTSPSSIYEWGLDHGSRNGTDTMALIIGPKQDYNPIKPGKSGRDQFMQMTDWLIEIGETSIKTEAGLGEIITCYSKKFGPNGTFQNNEGKNPFSLTPSSIYTEEWKIWIIADSKVSNGENPWGHYGSNAATAVNGNTIDLTKYNLYTVPSGQRETIFAFVSVGYVGSTAGTGNAKTYGNFLDNINFALYHPLSGSSTAHGSAIVMDSSNEGVNAEIDVNNNLATFVTDGKTLNIQAIIKNEDKDTCDFAGVYYSVQENGDLVSKFLKLYGNVSESFEDGKWVKTTNSDGDIIYTYELKNINSATNVHFVFIKSPTVTYDSNGGLPYYADKVYNTNELDNVYSFRPVQSEDYTFIEPYKSHAAEGLNENWKFTGWKLTGDLNDIEGVDKINADQINNMILPAEHIIACDYELSGATGTNYQYFKIYDSSASLSENKITNAVKWESDDTPLYANVHKGLTLVAQWRWKQNFVAQVKSESNYLNSLAGGTITFSLNDENTTAEASGVGYFAEGNEIISATAHPRDGYRFTGWYDEDGNLLSLNNTYGYTVSSRESKTSYARFVPVLTQNFKRQLLINGNYLDIDTDDAGTLSSYQIRDVEGTVVSSTAIPNSNYTFVGWYDNKGPVSSSLLSNSEKTITYSISDNVTYYARFKSNQVKNYGSYKVEHYYLDKNLNAATLPFETDILSAEIGTTVNAREKNVDGYIYLESYSDTVKSGLVNDDSLVLKLFYKPKDNTRYVVEHYKLNADFTDAVLVESQSKEGYTDDLVSTDAINVEGYIYDETFSNEHFTNIPSGTIKADGSLTLKLYYKPGKVLYTVKHIKLNSSGEIKTAQSEFLRGYSGTVITAVPKNFSGYSFDSAYSNGENITVQSGQIKPDGSLVLTLYYLPNADELIYRSSGAYDIRESGYTDEKLTVKNNTFVRNGYSFAKWIDNDNNIYYPGDEYLLTPEEDVLTAVWNKDTYTISYNLNGGSVANPLSYDVESDDIILNNPQKEGYEFKGWTGSNGSNTELRVTILKGSTGNRNYTAHYEAIDVTYKTEYYLLNSAHSEKTLYKEESHYAPSDTYVNADIISILGYDYVSFSEEIKDGNVKADGSLVLKVFYTPKADTLTYKSGEDIYVQHGYVGENVPVMDNYFTKEGHTFAGWEKDGTLYESNYYKLTPEDDILTARWSANSVNYSALHIKLDKNGAEIASESQNLSGTYGENTSVLPKSYEGYTFDASVSDYEGDIYSGKVFKLYYVSLNAKIIYHSNFDDQTKTEDCYFDETVSILNNTFGRANYVFKYWSSNPDGTGEIYYEGDDVNVNFTLKGLYANWQKITHSLIFKANTGMGDDQIITDGIGEEVYLIDNPFTKEGYRFKGWALNPEGSGTVYEEQDLYIIPENDLVFYAVWEEIPPQTVNYSVKHILLYSDLSVREIAHEETHTGEINTPVSIESRTISNYTYRSDLSISSGIISPGLELELYYLPNSTRIIYYANNGTDDTFVQDGYFYENSTAPVNTFEYTGYSFTSWNTEADGSGRDIPSGSLFEPEASEVSLYARWNRNTPVAATLNYNENPGADVPVNGNTGEYITLLPAMFTKDGFRFKAWNTEADGSGIDYAPGSTILLSADTTLFARWARLYKYKVTHTIYNKDNIVLNSYVDEYSEEEGTLVSADGNTYEGYKLTGAANLSGNVNSEGTLNLEFKYVPRTNTPYKVVHYFIDRNNVISEHEREDLAGTTGAVALAANKVYSDYLYDADNSLNIDSSTINADGSTVLKLYYREKKFNLTFKDGSSVQIISDYGDSSVNIIDNPIKDGYLFKGWNTSLDGSGDWYYESDLYRLNYSDAILYAQWAPLYTLTYKSNGGEGEDVLITSTEGTITLNNNSFIRSGYKFINWNTKADGTGTSYNEGDTISIDNLTLYAMWERIPERVEIPSKKPVVNTAAK